MMNQPPYKAIIGSVFILFSLIFFILLFQHNYHEYKEVLSGLDEYGIRQDFIKNDVVQLRQGVNGLNTDVNNIASKIGRFIIDGSRINDTIVHFMNQADANQHTLDTLEYLEKSLEKNDFRIDSLNRVFEKKSDSLMMLMREYSSREQSLRVLESKVRNHTEDLWYLKLFMLIYLFFLALGFVSGIFLLIRGLK